MKSIFASAPFQNRSSTGACPIRGAHTPLRNESERRATKDGDHCFATRAAVDTGSEEPATPRRSPAISTGSDETGVLRFETPTEKEEIFSLETSTVDVFFHSNCTSLEQECILLQPDVGMDNHNETTAQQAAAREEFERPTKKR